MLLQQEQANSSANLSQAQALPSEAVIYINSDGTIHSLNSTARRLLNVDKASQAEGQLLKDFMHFTLNSLTNVCQSFFDKTFSNSHTTVIPSVNATYAYTFSFDSDLNAVKLILKENPFN